MKKVVYALCFAFFLLVLGEVTLQVRAHMRFGQSVLNALAGDKTYQYNEELGIRLLRPNAKISGSRSIMETNSLGLRGPEISRKKSPNEIRLAIVGSSTVMGAYTRSNSNTLSARLEYYLQKSIPNKKITVINGGIAGNTLNDELLTVQKLLSRLDVDFYVLYSGFNDVKKYCRDKSLPGNGSADKWSLSRIHLPNWLLTVELITKNTVMLKNTPAGSEKFLDASAVDTSDYRESLRKLMSWVSDEGLPMIVLTNARAFRKDMPLDLQLKLSETARYYLECFDIDGLHIIYDRHNSVIEDIAKEYGFPCYDLMQRLPGGEKYFGDATHFSVEGTDLVARFLSEIILPELNKF